MLGRLCPNPTQVLPTHLFFLFGCGTQRSGEWLRQGVLDEKRFVRKCGWMVPLDDLDNLVRSDGFFASFYQ